MILRLTASVALVVLTVLPIHAAMLKGVVIEDEVGGAGMDNVPVSVDEAAANSTISKDGGHFAFTFPDKQAGETVHVRVNRPGYVVVNDVQPEVTLPANPDAKPLTVILCPKDEREKWAGFLYGVTSNKAIEESYEQQLKTSKEKYQADAAAFNAEKGRLQQERDQARAMAEKASEQLANSQSGQNTELYQKAKRLFLEGKVEEAIRLLDEEAKKAPEKPENAVQPRLLKAQLLTVQLRFEDAEKAYLQAIEIAPDSVEANVAYANFTQNLGSEHPNKATSLDDLGLLYQRMGEYAKAEALLQEALRIRQEVLGPENPDTATSLDNLALLYENMGEYAKAEPLYQEALAIYQKALGRDNQNTATSLNNLALLYQTKGDYAKAEPLLKEALEIYQKVLGREHPLTSQSLNNLAVLYQDMGEYAEAESLYQEALRIQQKVLGQENPDTATSLNNLALLYKAQGQDAKAAALFQRVLALWGKAADAGNSDAMFQLGMLYKIGEGVSQDYGKAREWFQKAADAGNTTAMASLGLQYANGQGVVLDYEKAREWFQKAADAGNSDAMFQLGMLYKIGEGASQDYGKAREWFQKAAAAGNLDAKEELSRLQQSSKPK